jgi:septum formation topological specificity factor MinE
MCEAAERLSTVLADDRCHTLAKVILVDRCAALVEIFLGVVTRYVHAMRAIHVMYFGTDLIVLAAQRQRQDDALPYDCSSHDIPSVVS